MWVRGGMSLFPSWNGGMNSAKRGKWLKHWRKRCEKQLDLILPLEIDMDCYGIGLLGEGAVADIPCIPHAYPLDGLFILPIG
jgi:hypothetical protein